MLYNDYFDEGIFTAREYDGPKARKWDDLSSDEKLGKSGRRRAKKINDLTTSINNLKTTKASGNLTKDQEKAINTHINRLESIRKEEATKAKGRLKRREQISNNKYKEYMRKKEEHDKKENARVSRNKKIGAGAAIAGMAGIGYGIKKWVDKAGLDEAVDIYAQGYYDALCALEEDYDYFY